MTTCVTKYLDFEINCCSLNFIFIKVSTNILSHFIIFRPQDDNCIYI